MIESIDTVLYTTIFLLPGFLILGIINQISPPKKQSEGTIILKCIMYSVINCACCSWIYVQVLKQSFSKPYFQWVLLLITTMIMALTIGVVIGVAKQKWIVGWLFSKLNINLIHPTQSAWDYCFFTKQKGSFVIVTLKDDSKIFGWYSECSFSSSDYEERDIYIEKEYRIDSNDQWEIDLESDGVYIPKDNIKAIEFKKGADDRNE